MVDGVSSEPVLTAARATRKRKQFHSGTTGAVDVHQKEPRRNTDESEQQKTVATNAQQSHSAAVSMCFVPPPPPLQANATPHDIATKIVTLVEPLDILSCAGKVLTSSSTEADIRKAYLWLSVKIHPDKLQGFEQANEAFQSLLRAYEMALKSLSKAPGTTGKRHACLNACFKTPNSL